MRAQGVWLSGERFLTEKGLWVAGAFALVMMIWATIYGQRLYAAHEQQVAIETEAENQLVCGRLNMPSGGSNYSACASELGGVRRKHQERTERHSAGTM